MASSSSEPRRKKRNTAKGEEVFYLPDLIRQVSEDPSCFLPPLPPPHEHGDYTRSPPLPRLCQERVRACVMQFCQKIFPTMDGSTARWEDVVRRFHNVVSMAVQQPTFLKVMDENKAVVSRTLFFSANWFCASTNICRQLPFKIFEDLFLLSTVGKKVKARSAVRVPYQISLDARERIAIFVLRTDFLIARVIHRTSTTKFKKQSRVVDPADLSACPEEISYYAEAWTSRIEIFVDIFISFHSAAEKWLLAVVRKKVGDVYGSAAKLRTLTENSLASVNDLIDFSTAGPFAALLQDISITLQELIQEFRAEHDAGIDLIVHNDLADVIEEVIQIFTQSFHEPGIRRSPGPNMSLFASAAVLYAQHHSQDTLAKNKESDEGGTVNLLDPAPRVFSPILPPMCHGSVAAEKKSSLAVLSAVACATSIAVKLVKSLNYHQESQLLQNMLSWRSTGQELAVHKEVETCQIRSSEEYRNLWEHVLLYEYMDSVVSACRHNLRDSCTPTDGVLIHISLSAVPATHHEGAFKHMQQALVAQNEQSVLTTLSPIVATVLLLCSCQYDGHVINEKQYGACSSIALCIIQNRNLYFGGTVSQCARVSEVSRNSDLSMHASICARLRHCQHSLLVSVVCGIQEEDREFVDGMRKDCMIFVELARRGTNTDDDMQLLWCSVAPLYNAITLVRCIRAARSVCDNSNVWPLISGNPSRRTKLRDTERRVSISSSKVASQSTVVASYDLVIAACQIWRTFGKINMGQWMVMHNTVKSLQSRQQEGECPMILLEGPPGTGKTSTIAKLISLLYHEIPAYEAPRTNMRKRRPSIRTLICTASNAGLDEILTRFVKEGVSTINFEPVTGAVNAQDSVSFTEWFKTVHDKAAKKELDCDTLIGSRSIRAPQSHVESLDEEEQSDIRVVRLGRTECVVARSFSCTHERSANFEEEMENDTSTRIPGQHSALASISEADVVFTTLATCGSEQLRNIGNFDFILIDEAGQATEPEVLIPLAKHFGPKTALLIVGDTHQLGPTVKSQQHVVSTILGTSFLQRMLKSRPEKIVSLRLNIQYRMHADIALFISRRFYGGGLSSHLATGRPAKLVLRGAPVSAVCIDTSMFCASSQTLLQVSRNRHLFHEAKEGTSFSNSGEAILVNKIVHTLLSENNDLKAAQIAVITPYTAQVRLIRQSLSEMSPAMTKNVDVDTIDAFQGSERSVVIIDLVRSEGSTIGFIGDERRSNVALSRAKDLVIVLGNMTTLKAKRPNPMVDWMQHCENLDASNVIKDGESLSKMWSLPRS